MLIPTTIILCGQVSSDDKHYLFGKSISSDFQMVTLFISFNNNNNI